MLLQGNLQIVFDALYHLGVIDPVLKMDWSKAMDEMHVNHKELKEIVKVANQHQQDVGMLKHHLEQFDMRTLSFLAMEVARELASLHTREHLH